MESHGSSDGLFGNIDSPLSFVYDSIKYIKTCLDIYRGLPVFLLGESMGGYIAL